VSDRVQFTCNGEQVEVSSGPGESLLSVLREQLGIMSVKDGCAPQGQCGCCTVLVDGDPRVACVTPVARVAGRVVTTVEGLEPSVRDALADAFVATGGSQCGFCTPGIVVRAAALREKRKDRKVDLDRALAAHLCRCTGWQTVYDAIERSVPGARGRDLDAAARRAALEGGVPQVVGPGVPLGAGGFADDHAPRDALVAVPCPPAKAEMVATIEAAGMSWVVAESLIEARALAGKVQGRRTTAEARPPFHAPALPPGGVRLVTGWVEPAYLEPDASWCAPGGEPAAPLANGGAFGGKADSPVGAAARALADRLGRTVRVVYSREDVVRLGPKRPPIAASAWYDGGTVTIAGVVVGAIDAFVAPIEWAYRVDEAGEWSSARVAGPATSVAFRAVGLAERAVLIEGALDAARVDRPSIARDERVARSLLDTCVPASFGTDPRALAGARVEIDDDGAIGRVEVRVAAGDPLDEIVLRSYSIGAAHMALGWVLNESLTVDPDSGEIHDLTVRSFGVIRAHDTPRIDIEIVDDAGPALPRASEAVFAAVAAAAWNAIARADGARPDAFPASSARAARRLRR
jgi:aerobic-type carbon monoxide dehydrogenase small subunit (CoxS/CutS family)